MDEDSDYDAWIVAIAGDVADEGCQMSPVSDRMLIAELLRILEKEPNAVS